MSAPARTDPKEPGTGMATRADIAREIRNAPAGTIPEAARAMIEERRAINEMTRQIAGMTWSKDLNETTSRAVAEYCRRKDIDPIMELEILGGRLYRNGYWYRRKLGALVAVGIITDIHAPDHIAADPRLAALAKEPGADGEWARTESSRRLRLRITHGVPEGAAAAVVQRIRVVGLADVVVGCNWCGGGVRRNDPVGEANPTLTAETRAFRRVGLKLADVMPSLRGQLTDEGEDGVQLEEAIAETKARVRAERVEEREQHPPMKSRVDLRAFPPAPRLTPEQLAENERATARQAEQPPTAEDDEPTMATPQQLKALANFAADPRVNTEERELLIATVDDEPITEEAAAKWLLRLRKSYPREDPQTAADSKAGTNGAPGAIGKAATTEPDLMDEITRQAREAQEPRSRGRREPVSYGGHGVIPE